MRDLNKNQYTLYTYYRSSSAYRVRIALNLKDLTYHSEFINLAKDGGQEKTAAYQEINPQKLVPSFSANGDILTQSLAIIEYLDEIHPLPALLPSSPIKRATVRAFASSIACDIQPLDNLRVLNYIKNTLNIEKKDRDNWYCHWILEGFSAMEIQLEKNAESFEYCFSDQPTLADIYLIPQVYNAQRFNCPIAQFPIISRIYDNCMQLTAFQNASPEEQTDFVKI